MARRSAGSVLKRSEGTRGFPKPRPEGGLEYRVSRQYRAVACVGFPFKHLGPIVIAEDTSSDLLLHPREQTRDWFQSKPPEGSCSPGSAPRCSFESVQHAATHRQPVKGQRCGQCCIPGAGGRATVIESGPVPDQVSLIHAVIMASQNLH